MPEVKQTAEEGFRSCLEDLIPVVQKIGPYCKNIEELIDLCELALTSDAQLKILMSIVTKK